MMIDSEKIDLQAVEAIAIDTVSFASMFTSLQQHPEAALLFPGLIPQASMFAVESRRYISTLSPQIKEALSSVKVDFLQQPRHRAKMLDNPNRSIEQVSGDLVKVAEQQRKLFLEPHKGFLGPLKRIIQPDLGITTYGDHIFSTTHAMAFNFSELGYDAENAFSIGQQLGNYIGSLLTLFGLQLPPPLPNAVLPEKITMKDIKSEALYRRGSLGMAPISLAAGMTFLLANLNYVHYITRGLLQQGELSLFRLKFISAYHANANLKVMQSRLSVDSSTPSETTKVVRDALETSESKWLRKQSKLRNLLVHYSVDGQLTPNLSKGATRKQTIEHLSNGVAFEEIDALLDRYLANITNVLEMGFRLSGDTFWYGKVSSNNRKAA